MGCFLEICSAANATSIRGGCLPVPAPTNLPPTIPSTTSVPIRRRRLIARASYGLRPNHADPSTNQRQSPQRPKIHRSNVPRRQSSLLLANALKSGIDAWSHIIPGERHRRPKSVGFRTAITHADSTTYAQIGFVPQSAPHMIQMRLLTPPERYRKLDSSAPRR